MAIDPKYPWNPVHARNECTCDRCRRTIFTGDTYWRCGARAGQRVMTGLKVRPTFYWVQACETCYQKHHR